MNIEVISKCQKCDLCANQQPLLQKNVKRASIFWVGLSAVKIVGLSDEEPLSPITNTGKLISEIENMLPSLDFYKTNVVKCLPLDKSGKIRYPTISEMNSCFQNIEIEIDKFNPRIVVLLGTQVSQFFLKQHNIKLTTFDDNFAYKAIGANNIKFLPIHHPSYIQIYKRKKSNEYKNSVSMAILSTYSSLS